MIPASIVRFFATRRIPVEFRDLPGHPLDVSLFAPAAHDRIVTAGFYSSSAVQLLQAAAVHYQGRYRRRPMRFVSACVELFPSLSAATGPLRTTRRPWPLGPPPNIRLAANESSEFQGKSSEVLAVGMGLSLVRELLEIGYKDIHTIETSGKRCDFSAEREGVTFVFETKGRRHQGQIKPAIQDIFVKKRNHEGPKYGFISHLPRDGSPASTVVVDPPHKLERTPYWERMSKILRYYSSAAHLAGLWRLGDLLHERSLAIRASRTTLGFDRVPLDFANILKLGRTLEISHSGGVSLMFIPAGRRPYTLFEAEEHAFVFGLNESLIHLLEKQDFKEILNFRAFTGVSHLGPRAKLIAQTNDDGTVIAAVPAELFD